MFTLLIHLVQCKISLYFTSPLQKLRQEFRALLGKAALVSQVEEEPKESLSTESHVFSPPRVLKSHQQYVVDYVYLLMEEGEDLTMGEDWAAPLITEVFSFSYTCFSGFSLNSFPFNSSQFVISFSGLT